MRRFMDRLRSLMSNRSKDGGQADGEALEGSTQALLALIPAATVVVDGDDEVVRSSPDAYRLGIVSNDEISNPKIIEAIAQVRRSGGRRSFNLITRTPTEFALDAAAESRESDDWEISQAQAVSRRNWLKVTLGRIDQSLVVVLIDDVSDSVRFVRTRDAFMTNVSEQMLKPVQALEELAAQLKTTSHLEGDDPELLRSHLRSVSKDASSVQRYSAYLGHVLKDLLLLIRAQERIKPSRENVLDVAEQIRAVVRDEQDRADQAHVTLRWRCDQPLTIHGDGQQIRVALAKLVENAVSYSSSGSTVSLVAQPSKDGRYGIIRVVDHGRGISKADQGRIFERFYRADNQNEETAVGIGLGLAIVKHVALTHHGSVTVWSAPGEGSTFTLMLPLAQGPVAGQDGDNPND
ncbi:sensor histidine kinase [Bifidobacterium mellis]|uniref:Sensor-like histidine kinase SenX3 n=1 Tax=Bifidobacterium mellis TaxID=1293823 RepID=A0A0F4KX02_9BIFI|nr:HAMP domain-containing sensor histidine kinase [Bifidobacterium mellis]KJY50524.1 Two-component system sensor histidine kinase [Bifidobacterium mellis]